MNGIRKGEIKVWKIVKGSTNRGDWAFFNYVEKKGNDKDYYQIFIDNVGDILPYYKDDVNGVFLYIDEITSCEIKYSDFYKKNIAKLTCRMSFPNSKNKVAEKPSNNPKPSTNDEPEIVEENDDDFDFGDDEDFDIDFD